mmetsp:Transcript_71687/g.134070  ORF Transcript_71687/g.134070 Transcript_71687/m.134070 type:complete len:244 (+) Transcript_71687:45-776(+)
MAEAETTDENVALQRAIEKVLAEQPEMSDAGPKAMLAALQAEGDYAGVSAPRCKRALQAVRKRLADQEAARQARLGTAFDCPKGHGLARFMTPHPSFCCDVCRVYQPQGSAMWGCRMCDWDVCEQRCRPKESHSLPDLRMTLESLELRATEAAAKPTVEAKSALAQVEAEVKRLEASLDSSDLDKLAKLEEAAGRGVVTREDMQKQRKAMLASVEQLFGRIDAAFEELKKKQAGEAQADGANP